MMRLSTSRARSTRCVAVGLLILAVGTAVVLAAPSGPTVLVDPTGSASHDFGAALASTAWQLFVGDPRSGEDETGVVWVYRRGSDHSESIEPGEGSVRSFGAALAANRHLLVVGAPGSPYVGSNDVGDVFVYRLRRGRWVEEAHLRPSDAIEGGRFGAAVATDGRRIVVGAPGQAPGFFEKLPGRFYVFERSGGEWQETERVVGGLDSTLGVSVDLDGDTLVAGDSNGPTGNRGDTGRVSVFRLGDGGLTLEAHLIGPDSGVEGSRYFGFRVDLDGENLAVGDFQSPLGSGLGAVYLFARTGNTWTPVDLLLPPEAGQKFGFALALAGRQLYVGAPWPTSLPIPPGGVTRGRVFHYRAAKRGWVYRGLVAPTPTGASHVGESLARFPGGLAVGAPVAVGKVLVYDNRR